MWGQPPPSPFDLPPMRLPNVLQTALPQFQTPPMAAAVQAQPKKGGGWKNIAGIIADALAGATGREGMYAPLKMRSRQMQMEEEREARREERERNKPIRAEIDNDYVEIDPTTSQAKVLYKGREKPASDEFSRYLEAAGIPEADRPAYYRKQVDNMVAPKVDYIQVEDPATGIKSIVPRPRVAASMNGAAPTSKEQYDALPPGAPYVAPDGSRRVKGGPTPQASGGFPRYR